MHGHIDVKNRPFQFINCTGHGTKCLKDEDINFGPLFCLPYNFIPSCVLVADINVSGNDTSIDPSINLSINQCIESAVLNIVSS